MKEGRMASRVFNLALYGGGRVFSFLGRPLQPPERTSYIHGTESWKCLQRLSGYREDERSLLPTPGNDLRRICHAEPSLVTILTEQLQLFVFYVSTTNCQLFVLPS